VRHSLEAAGELERSLRELMRLLDAGDCDLPALGQAAMACDAGFKALRASFEADDRCDRQGLARTLRSNAVALDLAGRSLEGVRERIARVRAARSALRQGSSSTATGGSCDVAG